MRTTIRDLDTDFDDRGGFFVMCARLIEPVNERISRALQAVGEDPSGPKNARSVRVVVMLWRRLVTLGRAIRCLYSNETSPDEFASATTILLRCTWDLALQLLYVVEERATLIERCAAYEAYVEIEKLKAVRAWQSADTDIAKVLVADREYDISSLEATYERLRPRFSRTCRDKRTREFDNWLGISFRDLAHEVGLRDEFDTFKKFHHSAIHSSGLTVLHQFGGGKYATIVYWALTFRVMLAACDALGVELTEVERQVANETAEMFQTAQSQEQD
jgi:hypothetical protein